MMRIVHVTSGLDRHAAGVGAAVAALSAAQRTRGEDVRVFGLSSLGWESGESAQWQGAPATTFRVRGQPRAFGYAPELAPALSGPSPDLVHVHGLWMYPGIAAARWQKRTGKPCVCSPHGMLSQVALGYSRWKKTLARRLFQNRALAAASLFHATAETEAADIRAFGLRQPIAIIPNGVDLPELPAPRAERQGRTVLFLGRMHPVKGLDGLLRAWSRIEAAHGDWRLRIVGPDEGGHCDELRRLARNLGLQRVTFEPPVYGPARTVLMADADLFVLPSRNENFAMTVAESLAVETPVISTKGAPWAGLEDNRCGWWIDHGDEALAATLQGAMALPDAERQAMGQRGRAWMERDFSWKRMAAMSLAAYDWTCGRGERPEFVIVD